MFTQTGKELSISKIEKDTIILMDNSKWKATGITSYKASLWLPLQKVVVEKSTFKYKMTNTSKKETIDVELA